MNLTPILKYKSKLIGLAVGCVLGWAYYYFVGCKDGTCMIASNAYIAIPYGGLMGYLFVGIIKK